MRILLFLLISQSLLGQAKDYSNKVQTLDATIETLYAVISGDKGVERDWELFRFLFHEDAKLIPLGKNKEGNIDARYLSADDYVKMSGEYLVDNGFIEEEIFRVTESFGSITQVFSTYQAFKSSADKEPFIRGINSIQLMNDGDRWYILNISWDSESEEHKIPEKYLPE